MTKIIKKVTATAAAIIALGAFGLSASGTEIKDWTVAHVNTPGAPSIPNCTTVYMTASKDTYCAMVQSMTNLATREVTITSETNYMNRAIKFNTPGIELSWKLESGYILNDVTYKVTATTSDIDVLSASGYIKRIC
ncbi:MAG: hypothetical protein ACI4JY_03975 [Oscillospiraceae bacterium]